MLSQMGPFLHLGPNVIINGAFGTSFYTCTLYKGLFPEPVLSNY